MRHSQDDRLDSWKAIARHLGRDVRTVRRWEKTLGLPAHRVGGRGRAVFAHASEIDAWLVAAPAAADDDKAADAAKTGGDDVSLLTSTKSPRSTPNAGRMERGARTAAIAAVSLLVVGFVAALWMHPAAASASALGLRMSDSDVIATAADGSEKWRYTLAPDGETVFPLSGRPESLEWEAGDPAEVLAAYAVRSRIRDLDVSGGELLWLSPAGQRMHSVAFDEHLQFHASSYSAPWVIAGFRVAPGGGPRRIAVAARHYTWWPGFVALLDDAGHRIGTFVNSGWVDQVAWVSPDRLVAAGFSNSRDGGMVALLDTRRLSGHSPEPADSEFACRSCPEGAALLRYAVFPRSAVNKASGAPFNRATVTIEHGVIVVRTIEHPVEGLTGAAEVVYEFSPDLDLIHASYGDRYRDFARMLGGRGLLKPVDAATTPPAIQMWDPARGWRSVRVP